MEGKKLDELRKNYCETIGPNCEGCFYVCDNDFCLFGDYPQTPDLKSIHEADDKMIKFMVSCGQHTKNGEEGRYV